VPAHVRHALLVTLLYASLFTLFFSPVVFTSRVLAPGDALVYYLPNFLGPRVLWDRLILSGFPAFADPQVMLWYPVSMLFSLFELWNGFLISAYVMASCFTYGYVHAVTRSRLAGAAAGIVYGMSGFMMAHLGHTSIVHGAAWLPLLVWAFEELRAKLRIGWLVIGSLAIACSLLAHPQIFLQGQMVCLPYVLLLGWNAPIGRWRYYLASAVVVGVGVGVAAIQWVPTAELSAWSVREQMTFQEFTSYALPVRQLPSLLFPYLFGGWPSSYGVRYFGRWNLVELAGYAGLAPLALAAIGVITWRRRSLALFWVAIGLLAALLTLGAATPLALITFHVPVINKFRAPGRHFLEVALAISVLAGLGVSSVLRGRAGSRLVLLVSAALIGTTGACLGGVMVFSKYIRALAPEEVGDLRLAPWAYLPTAVPLGILLLGLGVLACWSRQPRQGWRGAALLVMLVVDLASFGWFAYWRDWSPATHVLEPAEIADRYRPILDAARQRLMPLRGGRGSRAEVMPNLSRLWDVPSASGYGPLLLRRVGLMVSMNPAGMVDDRALKTDDQGLDLLAVRFITLPKASPPARHADVKWSPVEHDLSTGVGCGASARPLEFDLPEPVVATKIGVVSWLGCSTEIPDGTAVAEVVVTDGKSERTYDLRAGRDSAEFAYDCANVRPHVKHRRAPVFSSFPIDRPRDPCEGHRYVSFLSLKDATAIRSVSVRWTTGEGVLALRSLTLIDEARNVSYPLEKSVVPRGNRWRHVEDYREITVYQNMSVRPRAWLVPEAIAAGPEEILNAIKTSKLADGRPFNPARTALVEDSRLAFSTESFDAGATAEVTRLSGGSVDVRTSATSASFLVMSDIYYPGWDVSIDGQPAKLVLTDYTLRGVVVPAGAHRVRFTFRPTSLWVGAAISVVSLIALAGICVVSRRRRD
jgi:hypothetical protein